MGGGGDGPIRIVSKIPPPPVDIIEGTYSSYQSNGRTKAKITIDVAPLNKDEYRIMVKGDIIRP